MREGRGRCCEWCTRQVLLPVPPHPLFLFVFNFFFIYIFNLQIHISPFTFYIYSSHSSTNLHALFHRLPTKPTNSIRFLLNQISNPFSLSISFTNHHEAIDSPSFPCRRFIAVLSSPLRLSRRRRRRHQTSSFSNPPFRHCAARPRPCLRRRRDGTVRRQRSTPKSPCFHRAPW